MLIIQNSSSPPNPTPVASLFAKGNCSEMLPAFSGSYLPMFKGDAYTAIFKFINV